MNTTATPSNGKKPPAVPPQQTVDDTTVKAAIAHHVSSYDRVCGERDALQKVVDRQEQMLTVARIEIEGLRAQFAAEQSRVVSYQTERDDAVAKLGVYQTLFISTMAQWRAFAIDNSPLVREKPDAP